MCGNMTRGQQKRQETDRPSARAHDDSTYPTQIGLLVPNFLVPHTPPQYRTARAAKDKLHALAQSLDILSHPARTYTHQHSKHAVLTPRGTSGPHTVSQTRRSHSSLTQHLTTAHHTVRAQTRSHQTLSLATWSHFRRAVSFPARTFCAHDDAVSVLLRTVPRDSMATDHTRRLQSSTRAGSEHHKETQHTAKRRLLSDQEKTARA